MGNSSFFILLIGVISPHLYLTADQPPPWGPARNTWNHRGTDFLPFLLCYLVVISTKKRSLFLVKNNPCSLLVLTLGISLANMLIQKMFFLMCSGFEAKTYTTWKKNLRRVWCGSEPPVFSNSSKCWPDFHGRVNPMEAGFGSKKSSSVGNFSATYIGVS